MSNFFDDQDENIDNSYYTYTQIIYYHSSIHTEIISSSGDFYYRVRMIFSPLSDIMAIKLVLYNIYPFGISLVRIIRFLFFRTLPQKSEIFGSIFIGNQHSCEILDESNPLQHIRSKQEFISRIYYL